jgi:hypothetical protein
MSTTQVKGWPRDPEQAPPESRLGRAHASWRAADAYLGSLIGLQNELRAQQVRYQSAVAVATRQSDMVEVAAAKAGIEVLAAELERLGHRSPAAVRAAFADEIAA